MIGALDLRHRAVGATPIAPARRFHFDAPEPVRHEPAANRKFDGLYPVDGGKCESANAAHASAITAGYSAPMLMVLRTAWAGSFLTGQGPDVTLPIGGTFARAYDDGAGAFDLFFAAGGDYNMVAMSAALVAEDRNRKRLTNRTDLQDHSIRRCPDGTWLHAASSTTTTPNDTATMFTYAADFSRLSEMPLDVGNDDIEHNDMALVCGERSIIGFTEYGGVQWLFEVDAIGAEVSRNRYHNITQMMGGGLAFSGTDIVAFGLPADHEMQFARWNDDLEEVETVAVPGMTHGAEHPYWPQGVERIGDYWLVAGMARDESDGFSADNGNVRLTVIDDSQTVVEERTLTSYAPPNGGMRPWLLRDGARIIVTWDAANAPHAMSVDIDPTAFGEAGPGDSGDSGSAGDSGDSAVGDSSEPGDSGEVGDSGADSGNGSGEKCGCGSGAGDSIGPGLIAFAAGFSRRRKRR